MPAGRPTKCTPELTEQFAGYMAAGLYFEDACDLCGIGRRTAYDWLKWGEEALDAAGGNLDDVPEEKRVYARFSHTVRARAAQAIARNLAIIQRAATAEVEGDWRAAEAFLKMRRPDTWGMRKQRHEVSGAGGGPVEVKHDGLNGADRTQEIVNILRQAGVVEGPEAAAADSSEAD